MKKGIFYLLKQPVLIKKLYEDEFIACNLSVKIWSKKRILIACNTRQQAEKIDNALWDIYPNRFVPHNLSGEGPKNGSPIEICWPENKIINQKDILINLQNQYLNSISNFCKIIDFVPADNTLKQLARKRYLFYRKAGFNLTII